MSSGARTDVRSYANYVNGQWVASASGETFPVYDPSTEEVIARVASADKIDVNQAVNAAREAFDAGPWRHTTAQDRGRILFKLTAKIRQNAAELADLECRNTGFLGRTGIYEMMKVSTHVRQMIQPNLDLAKLGETALAEGMRPLRVSAAAQVARGITTIAEVVGVLPPVEG